MNDYVKKTCNVCGLRDIQPNMHRVEKEVTTGSSNTDITKRTLFGAMLGEKSSQKALSKWAYSPNKRKYKRKREVWMCGDCAGVNKTEMSTIGFTIASLFWVGVLSGILYWFTGISPVDVVEWFQSF